MHGVGNIGMGMGTIAILLIIVLGRIRGKVLNDGLKRRMREIVLPHRYPDNLQFAVSAFPDKIAFGWRQIGILDRHRLVLKSGLL